MQRCGNKQGLYLAFNCTYQNRLLHEIVLEKMSFLLRISGIRDEAAVSVMSACQHASDDSAVYVAACADITTARSCSSAMLVPLLIIYLRR